jgi:cytochrome P450
MSDGAAIHPIYVENGGFMKSAIYRNFDIEGFPTIFSVVDHAHRAIRAKAVAPMFAHQAIANSRPAMQKIIDATIIEIEHQKSLAAGKPVDLYNIFRAMAMDVMTEYLVGECFNSVGSKKFSAAAFVENFAAVGRFFNLPGWIFGFIDNWAAKFHKNRVAIAASSDIVQRFAAKVVDDSINKGEEETYQGRLLSENISREEAIAQIQDIMFAGTDGEARILAVFCWYLVQVPDK